MTDDFPSVSLFFSEDHIFLEIEMLFEFIPARLFFLSFGLPSTYKDSQF